MPALRVCARRLWRSGSTTRLIGISVLSIQILDEEGKPCKPDITNRRQLYRALAAAVKENLKNAPKFQPPQSAKSAKAAAKAGGSSGGSSKKKKKKK